MLLQDTDSAGRTRSTLSWKQGQILADKRIPPTLPRTKNCQPSPPTAPSADALHIQSLLTDIVLSNGLGNTALSNVPVRFGTFNGDFPGHRTEACTLLNSEFACYACQCLQFDWAVYLFSNGHFCSSISCRNLPFQITIACNPYESGQALFQEFATGTCVFGSGNELLNHIWASGETSPIHGYLIKSYQF